MARGTETLLLLGLVACSELPPDAAPATVAPAHVGDFFGALEALDAVTTVPVGADEPTSEVVAVPSDPVVVGDAVPTPVDVGEPVPPMTLEAPIFASVSVPGLTDHVVHVPAYDALGYGAGAGYFDLDADGDLDLFLGQTHADGEPACVYENQSSLGALRFVRRDELCPDDVFAGATGAQALDLDHDGRDELVVYGTHILVLADFDDGLVTEDLFALRDVPEAQRSCPVATVQPYDEDLDGTLDLLVACHMIIEPTSATNYDNFMLRGRGETFEAVARADAMTFSDAGNTLAYGVMDVDDDGLLDVLAINDTFSRPQRRNFGLLPGGWVRRCDPTEVCTYTSTPWAQRSAQYGSMMGVAPILLDDVAHFYLDDWGPNRLVHFVDGVPYDTAFERGAQLAQHDGQWLFAWGAVPDDYNGDGREDLFVPQGSVVPVEADYYGDHYDALLLQNADGRFEVFSSTAGLASHPRDRDLGIPPGSRAATSVDLDHDGRLDLVVNVNRGPRRVYQEREARQRCTVFVEPSVVPSVGEGVAYRGEDERVWRPAIVGGAHTTGYPSAFVSRYDAGEVRMPSGAVLPFACDATHVTTVVEPMWLGITVVGGLLEVTIDASVDRPSGVTVAVRDTDENVRVETLAESAGVWRVALSPSDVAVMVRLDGRWVGRWFGLLGG